MEKEKIFIPGNVPSSKNSRRNFGNLSLPSKATVQWRNNTAIYWAKHRNTFKKMIKGKEKPYKINFLFVRGTKHAFDYINPAQTIQDEMVKYRWIEDDDCHNIIPNFSPYIYDKNKAGVFISVD